MTSKFNHCYSNYVNHILNTSPSKLSYSFAKGQRFSSPKKQKEAPVDKILQKNIHPDVAKRYGVQLPLNINLSPENMLNNYLLPQKQTNKSNKKKKSPNLKSDQKRSKSKSQKIQKSLLDKYLGSQTKKVQQRQPKVKFERSPIKHSNQKVSKPYRQELRVFQTNRSSPGKRKVWQKGQDPFRKQRFPQNCLYSDMMYHYQPPLLPIDYPPPNLMYETNYLKDPYNPYMKYSPYYPSYVAQNQERLQQLLSKSRDKSAKKLNRSVSEKGNTKHHRAKTVTDVLVQMDYPSKNITIQGYYPVGTEIKPDGKYPISTYKNISTHSFGHPTDQKGNNKSKSPNKKGNPNKQRQKNLTRDASSANIPKSSETYSPFSEFGYVQPFKY